MTEVEVMEEQAGFRAGRGCSDQSFVMRRLVESEAGMAIQCLSGHSGLVSKGTVPRKSQD